jgi:hypothetical protein
MSELNLDYLKMEEEEFVEAFSAFLELIQEDPLENFIKNPLFMNLTPTPAQAVALKCAFGQLLDKKTKHEVSMEYTTTLGNFALRKVKMTEVQLYEYMTDQKYKEGEQTSRNCINLIVGRRGGKSLIAAMLAIYCAIKLNWKPFLKKTPAATVAILSHSIEFSEEILELIKELIEASPILTRLIDHSKKHTKSTFNLSVPFVGKQGTTYSRVTVKVGTASKKTIRGKAICALLCDEIAFWNLDEKAAERDEDILRAARPSLLQFKGNSMLLKLSSPSIRQGVLYDEYTKGQKRTLPPNYINLKAPSWVWNTILGQKEILTEYQLDPQGFDCEYRANFVDSISTFILPEYVDLCTQQGISFLAPDPPNSNTVYVAAIDAAFKKDRFAFTIVGWNGHRLRQYIVKTWEGVRHKPVKAKDVAEYASKIMKDFKINKIYADQYAFQPLKEIFEQHNLMLEERPFTNTYKKKIYFNLKKHIHNRTIDLLDNKICINEIKQLQVEQAATGTIRIGHQVGGGDDCSDSLAIASLVLMEESHSFGINSDSDGPQEIKTDIHGRAFNSPSSEMVAEVMGTEFTDNLNEYVQDPITKEWKHISQIDSQEASIPDESYYTGNSED